MTLKVIDYNDKCIVVVGETKAIKDELKSHGSKFNPYLSCGAGWIFSKKKAVKLTAAVGQEITHDQFRELMKVESAE